MTDKVTPHLRYPFKWGASGSAETVEQGSPDDIMQCAFAVLNTRLGQRVDLPSFGSRSQALQENGPSLEEMEATLLEWEPRAHAVLTKRQLEDLKSSLVNVGIKVANDAS